MASCLSCSCHDHVDRFHDISLSAKCVLFLFHADRYSWEVEVLFLLSIMKCCTTVFLHIMPYLPCEVMADAHFHFCICNLFLISHNRVIELGLVSYIQNMVGLCLTGARLVLICKLNTKGRNTVILWNSISLWPAVPDMASNASAMFYWIINMSYLEVIDKLNCFSMLSTTQELNSNIGCNV
jgi:hypothetical protein